MTSLVQMVYLEYDGDYRLFFMFVFFVFKKDKLKGDRSVLCLNNGGQVCHLWMERGR